MKRLGVLAALTVGLAACFSTASEDDSSSQAQPLVEMVPADPVEAALPPKCLEPAAHFSQCCTDGRLNSDIDSKQQGKCLADLAKQNDTAIKACQKNATSADTCLACKKLCDPVNLPASCTVAGSGYSCLNALCGDANDTTCKKKFPAEAGVVEATPELPFPN